jgi:hypothetical protein
MDGFAESIDAEAGLTGAFAVNDDRECEFDASESGPWSALRGAVLSDVPAAWQLRSEYAPGETAWAVRLLFASGRAVVIPWGRSTAGALEYLPDALVVFFDEKQADTYRDEYEVSEGESPAVAASRRELGDRAPCDA